MVRLIFAFGVGFVVAFVAFKWVTNPVPRAERQLEESVVIAARQLLGETLAIDGFDIVDPLLPSRKVGKSYVYRAENGWEVSGYYRRSEDDRWHPFLMALDESHTLMRLKVGDSDLMGRAETDPRLEAVP